jgi:hypothetical protein
MSGKEETFLRAIYQVLHTFFILHVTFYQSGRRSAQCCSTYAERPSILPYRQPTFASIPHFPRAFLIGSLPPVGSTFRKLPPFVCASNRLGSTRLTTTLSPCFSAANPSFHSRRLRLTIPASLSFFPIARRSTTSCNPASLSISIFATVNVLPPATSQES